MWDGERYKKTLISALKISVGSCLAIYIAASLNLEFATSAGSITLLTILTTKWDTLKLSLARALTFFVSVFLSYIFFEHISSDWAAYGIFVFVMTVLLESFGWKAALSVNAVIGTHFLTTDDFSVHFILNEFYLVSLGISIAVVLNLFNDNKGQKRLIEQRVNNTEIAMTTILSKLGRYMASMPIEGNVWDDIKSLERNIEESIGLAYEYQNNTFSTSPGYYIDYFEMRAKQCNTLHNLHYELKKIRNMPKQAEIVSEYVLYLKNFVTEMNDPAEQIGRLNLIFEGMKEEELPKTREEFENRAKLYHVLMDLEEFLIYKRRFITLAKKGKLKNTSGYLRKWVRAFKSKNKREVK